MIYFARHGESTSNLKGVFAGAKDDVELTEKGREQAHATALTIQEGGVKMDAIIASPLKRTLETARIIAKTLGLDPAEITLDPRLTEYNVGSLKGTPTKDMSAARLTTAVGAEDTDLFRERVDQAAQEWSQLPGNILVVSHAGVGRMLEIIRTKGDPKLFYDLPAWPNASVTKLDWLDQTAY